MSGRARTGNAQGHISCRPSRHRRHVALGTRGSWAASATTRLVSTCPRHFISHVGNYLLTGSLGHFWLGSHSKCHMWHVRGVCRSPHLQIADCGVGQRALCSCSRRLHILSTTTVVARDGHPNCPVPRPSRQRLLLRARAEIRETTGRFPDKAVRKHLLEQMRSHLVGKTGVLSPPDSPRSASFFARTAESGSLGHVSRVPCRRV